MPERIGYDELLASGVKQLREIDERIELVKQQCKPNGDIFRAWQLSRDLRADIAVMIAHAEAEHEAF